MLLQLLLVIILHPYFSPVRLPFSSTTCSFVCFFFSSLYLTLSLPLFHRNIIITCLSFASSSVCLILPLTIHCPAESTGNLCLIESRTFPWLHTKCLGKEKNLMQLMFAEMDNNVVYKYLLV